MSSTSCESRKQLLARATTYSPQAPSDGDGENEDLMLKHNPSGNYRFLAAEGRPFSGGAVADEGYDLVHARFRRPVLLEAGLAAAARQVAAAGRPVQAIAGFELRIPRPLTQAAFDSFNQRYVTSLRRLGLEVDGLLPAARTNVAAVVGGGSEPRVYAVSYSIPGQRIRPAFVLSGAPEEEGGDTAARLDSIMHVLSGRLDAVGASWDGGAAIHGIQWFPSLPPIEGLKLEIDVRSAGTELVLSGS